MHLVIPFAASGSEACQSALPKLKLPRLQKLLSRMQVLAIDSASETSLTPPHERALAAAHGLPGPDGLTPWAAWHASNSGQAIDPGLGGHGGYLPQPNALHDGAWAFISLCHWRLGTHHVLMSPLPLPDFTAQESNDLLSAMQPYFAEDGITLHADQPGRWLAQGKLFKDLPTAALDRVVGRHVKPWLPSGSKATPLLRLQNEMQMLLYTHPVNDAREAVGLTPSNSFWIHGTGTLDQFRPQPGPAPVVVTTLRHAALAENWSAWGSAWQALDACEGQALLQRQASAEPLKITLCGERGFQTWVSQPRSVMQKITGIFSRQSLTSVLQQL